MTKSTPNTLSLTQNRRNQMTKSLGQEAYEYYHEVKIKVLKISAWMTFYDHVDVLVKDIAAQR